MHIETELDDIYTERLLQLQRRLQKPLAQVIATAIDTALDQTRFGRKNRTFTVVSSF